MSKISSDFERFMIANFPDDYRRATASDVKEDVINSIYSKLEDEYKKWCRVPEWIKAEYRDDLPDEVLNGSKSVREFINEEEEENQKEQERIQEATDYGVSLLAAGYAAESASLLLSNRAERNRMQMEACNCDKMTDEERKEFLEKWRKTRERDKQVILKDWKEKQPEKYLLHLAKELSRAKRRENLAESANEKIAIGIKEDALKEELVRTARKLKDEKTRANLVDYLRGERQQAGLARLHPEILEMFTNVLAENGLKLEANHNSSVDKEFKLDKNSLVYELKLQYEREKGAVGDKLETYMVDNLSFGSSKDKVRQVDVSGLSNELINMRKMVKGQQRV